jgi:hypothetical protein
MLSLSYSHLSFSKNLGVCHVVLKLRQPRGWEWEYLVKWKRYHPIGAFWVNELDMEHGKKTIKKFHNKLVKKQNKCRM